MPLACCFISFCRCITLIGNFNFPKSCSSIVIEVELAFKEGGKTTNTAPA